MSTTQQTAPFQRAARARGFTLLEAVLALAILGIGVGVIFEGLAQGLRLRADAAANVALSLAAERVLGEIATRAEAPSAAEEGEEGGVRWRVEPAAGTGARPEVTEGRPEGLVEVRIALEAAGGRSWELTTLLPAPAAGKP